VSAEPEDDDPFGFTIHLELGVVVYDCGFHAKIVDMHDRDGESVIDPAECEGVIVEMPSDVGWAVTSVDLSDIDEEDLETWH
jgi:hypothetical protein